MRLVLSLILMRALCGAAEPAAPPSPVGPAAETLDSAESFPPPAFPAAAAATATPEPTAAPAADTAQAAESPATALSRRPLEIRNAVLERLDLSGTVQLKGFYHDFASDRDSDKRASLQLRRFKLGLEGAVTERLGFRGEFLLDGANKSFGAEDAYLWWRIGEKSGLKGGKLKRPFSQEALQSSKSLYTVERGEVYHDFLANTTGYALYDLGLLAYGGFEEDGMALGYELGVFNGKQSDKGYANQQDEKTDAGFFAKDVAARVTASPFRALKLEAGVSTKAAEDKSDKYDFGFAVNTAYEVGADLALGPARLLGEVAWGDNHQGADSLILSGSSEFFAFYVTGVWREDYRGGRASELVLKLEGLDPDFGWEAGAGEPNDGVLRYTAGCNFFFTPAVSVMADYGVLQPITKMPGKGRLIHSLDAMWRLAF